MNFEWDPEKSRENLHRHKVSFQEASTVFGDPLAVSFPDPDEVSGEHRRLTVGCSARGRVLVVSHMERSGRVRLISARKATRRERKDHEEGSW